MMFKAQETAFYMLEDNAFLELEGGKGTPHGTDQNVSGEICPALCFTVSEKSREL